jgi:uncharacterized protein
MSREEVLSTLRAMRPELESRHTVRRLGLFGSFARGSEGPGSDVDVVIELQVPSFDHYMDVKLALEDRLGRPVDLVLLDAVKPRLLAELQRDVIYV